MASPSAAPLRQLSAFSRASAVRHSRRPAHRAPISASAGNQAWPSACGGRLTPSETNNSYGKFIGLMCGAGHSQNRHWIIDDIIDEVY